MNGDTNGKSAAVVERIQVPVGRAPAGLAPGTSTHPVRGANLACGRSGSSPVGKHTISLYVNNKPGVLIRIALVFARRGYNIDSLVVSEGHDPRFSHMNITATGDEQTLQQILRQLNKLVDVIHAKDHTGDDIIQQDLALIKLRCSARSIGTVFCKWCEPGTS